MKFPSISFDNSNQPRMLKNECVREGIIKRNCQNTNYVFTSVGWVSSPSTCSACNFLFDESSTPHPISNKYESFDHRTKLVTYQNCLFQVWNWGYQLRFLVKLVVCKSHCLRMVVLTVLLFVTILFVLNLHLQYQISISNIAKFHWKDGAAGFSEVAQCITW